jgi:hypothetical protein
MQVTSTRSTRGEVFAVVATPQRRRADRRFYVGMTLVLFAIVIAGLAPGIVKPDTRIAPLTSMVGLHGLIFTAWLVLFVVQTVLITSRKAGLHRRLGMEGGLLRTPASPPRVAVIFPLLRGRARARRPYLAVGGGIGRPRPTGTFPKRQLARRRGGR